LLSLVLALQGITLANPLLLFSAQIIASFSVLLLAVGFIKTEPKAASARVFAVLAVFVVFYLINGMTADHIDPQFKLDLSSFALPMQTGSNSIPGLFMIYCFLIFQEQQKFPIALAIIFALQVVLDLLLVILYTGTSTATGLISVIPLLSTLLDILMLFFVGCAIYWTIKGWRADLVEDRRALRWFIIGVQGGLIFAVVFVENFLLANGSVANATVQALIVYAVAFLALGMLVVAIRFDYVSLGYVIRKVAKLGEKPKGRVVVTFDAESFNAAFREGNMYREAGLTIAMLAKKLELPEYRLRAFIHQKLGFRNFNSMLHQYRVEDASLALSDKANQSASVLTIALSVGYQSITPFNNAFRQIKGVTPSEFRKKSANNN
jgi:AraC-like DNA-binding protein